MTKEEITKIYYKERARIKRLTTYYANRGFDFQDAEILPKIPKKITEGSINKLQKITKETIQLKGIYTDKETLETITGKTYVERQKQNKSKPTPVAQQKQNKPTTYVEQQNNPPLTFVEQQNKTAPTSIEQNKYKPKSTTKNNAKETREKHYKSGKRKKGKGKPPEQATEGIANTYDEMTNKPYSNYSDSDSKWYSENETAYLSEQDENYLNFLQQQVDEINSWSPKSQWSANLQEVKASHRSQLISIFRQAIEKLGKLQVARNISNHISELTEMINKVLYAGSGKDAVRMFDEIHNDLKRLPTILEDRALSVEESQPYTDAMETEEIFDYFDVV